MTEQKLAKTSSTAGPAPRARPAAGSEILSRRQCLELLAGVGLGRVAVSVRALPTVLPVRFALIGDAVVFPAAPGSELEGAVRGAVVAFEADHVDPGGGWSVVVTGVVAEVCDEDALMFKAASSLATGSDQPQCFFRMATDVVSGRRLPTAPLHLAGVALAPTPAGSAAPPEFPAVLPFLVDPAPGPPIPAEECVPLLATEEIGRLVVVLDGQPLMFPLNYALDGDAVVFRTAPGTKLEAISRSLVAFEVDRWSPSGQSGWSVVVEGIAQEVTAADAPGLRERLARLPVRPLVTGDRLHFVRIAPVSITGRRLRPARG